MESPKVTYFIWLEVLLLDFWCIVVQKALTNSMILILPGHVSVKISYLSSTVTGILNLVFAHTEHSHTDLSQKDAHYFGLKFMPGIATWSFRHVYCHFEKITSIRIHSLFFYTLLLLLLSFPCKSTLRPSTHSVRVVRSRRRRRRIAKIAEFNCLRWRSPRVWAICSFRWEISSLVVC